MINMRKSAKNRKAREEKRNEDEAARYLREQVRQCAKQISKRLENGGIKDE